MLNIRMAIPVRAAPASYTHLDVYKRQDHLLSMEQVHGSAQVGSLPAGRESGTREGQQRTKDV